MKILSGRSGLCGIVLVLLAAGMWATVGVTVQLVPAAASLPPDVLGLLRTVLAGPIILIAALPMVKPNLPGLRTLSLRRLFEFGVAGVVFQVCLFRSFDSLGVTLTVVLTVCLPPVIAILWSSLRGAAIGPGAVAALGLAVAGLALCSAQSLTGGAGVRAVGGICLAVVASLAFVWMTQSARHLSRTLSPILVAGLGLTLSGVIFCAISPMLLAEPLQVLAGLSQDWTVVGLILYLAVVPTALAYICYCTGIALCRATWVGLVASMIEPALAALFATSLLHEFLTPVETAGCLAMVMAISVLMYAEGRPAPVRDGTFA